MKNTIFSLLLTVAVALSVNAQSAADFFAATDNFLGQHVTAGKVDYKTISADASELNKLVSQIETFDPGSSDVSEQMAFYLNAYNILVIKNVVDNSPLNSPLDLKGFFDEITFGVAGHRLTLNQIENEVIRPTFKDARIHFALVCGANGCPPITATAFTAANVDSKLETATTNAINDPSFIQINTEQGLVYASEIFKWYIADFGDNDAGIIGFINQYSKSDVSNFGLDYYTYDWQLNQN